MNNNTFKIIENGKEETFHIIKLVKYKDKNYIIYEDKNKEIYSSIYEVIDKNIVISDIEDDSVYDYLDSILGDKNE